MCETGYASEMESVLYGSAADCQNGFGIAMDLLSKELSLENISKSFELVGIPQFGMTDSVVQDYVPDPIPQIFSNDSFFTPSELMIPENYFNSV